MRIRLPMSRARLRRKASSWLARLEGDDPEAVRPDFERWYRADPRHAEAFDRVRGHYRQMGLLRTSPGAREPLPEPRSHPAAGKRRYALAAALAAAVLVPSALLVADRMFAPATQALLLSTRIGEIREVPLADGSSVTLDTQTSLRVEIGRNRRSATLEHGRARFSIARAGTPFVIRSGPASVSSKGGVMDVARDGDGGRLDLIAGAAEIAAHGPAGEAIELRSPATVLDPGAPAQRLVAGQRSPQWPSGRLEFESATLAEVAAEANRYSVRRIVIGDPAVASLRVTGVFGAGDARQLAGKLARAFDLELREDRAGNLILESRAGPPG